MTADGNRIYVGWSARGFATTRPDPTTGDARVVMSTSPTGAVWTPPRAVDESGVPGHQIMPALTYGGGKLSLAYYDFREDVSGLFGPYVDELPILTATPPGLRHTFDTRIAQAAPGAQPQFTSAQLSSYSFGALSGGRAAPAVAVQSAGPADFQTRDGTVRGGLPRRRGVAVDHAERGRHMGVQHRVGRFGGRPRGLDG